MFLRGSVVLAAIVLATPMVRGEPPPNPLAAMLEAAAASADVDPDRVPQPRFVGAASLVRGALEQARREAVQRAVRVEVERERVEQGKGRGPATLPPGHGGQPPGQSISAQARDAAGQAQDAARNKDVVRGRGRPDVPLGKEPDKAGGRGSN